MTAEEAKPRRRKAAPTTFDPTQSPPQTAQYIQHSQTNTDMDYQQIAKLLGWFSLALGLAQILTPRMVSRLIGVRPTSTSRLLMRAVGVREIIAGIGILTQWKPVGWVQFRVMGDAMDLALLSTAFTSRKAHRAKLLTSTASVLGITALDAMDSEGLRRETGKQGITLGVSEPIRFTQSITINRPAEELYSYWRNFENLPNFMSNVEAVQVTGDGRSHWKVEGPANTTVEWDAKITEDRPSQYIAWRSLPGADISNAGVVMFRPAPGDRGTEVRVEMEYQAPGGKLGAFIAKLTGEEPELQTADDLRIFKQIMETGQVIRSEGAVMGKRLKHRPAQPPENPNAVM